eukprot:TRINITY_DN3942_c2_g3_i1.p1 TRINITY_DN3942_c2_g3~~TRINITY_DN3942_c2_g3_i1.p1  ORF type:complete len:110 (-),score=5.43 TRINITY_DN3942_c2_g3_i1:138-467(-)
MAKKRLHDNVVVMDYMFKPKNQAIALFLDFRKAFDLISHTFFSAILTTHIYISHLLFFLHLLFTVCNINLYHSQSVTSRPTPNTNLQGITSRRSNFRMQEREGLRSHLS